MVEAAKRLKKRRKLVACIAPAACAIDTSSASFGRGFPGDDGSGEREQIAAKESDGDLTLPLVSEVLIGVKFGPHEVGLEVGGVQKSAQKGGKEKVSKMSKKRVNQEFKLSKKGGGVERRRLKTWQEACQKGEDVGELKVRHD